MYDVTITFNVNGQIISRNENDMTLLSDSIDLIKARFNFSPEWQGYTKTAIFKSSTKRPYSRILVDDVCMVPPEAIKKSKHMSVSVFGVSGTQLITTTDQIVPLTPSGYTDNSIVSPAPTENIYQQIVTLMQRQAVDAVRAETAQGKAEEAERTAKSHAEQTGEDRIATGEDRVATGADRSAVNTALLGFAETTLPDAIQAVEDKADTEIARVGQASDTQVQAVNAAGAEQIRLATEQADRAEGEADKSTSQASKSESYAVGGTGTRPGEDEDNSKHYSEVAQTAAQTATQRAAEAAQHDILTQTGLTVEQQITARTNINAAPVAGSYELIEAITLTEDVTQIIRTEEPDATPYALKAALVGLSTPAGAGTGAVGFAFQANTTFLGFASMSSAITSSGAISTGEMFLRHGRWNVEAVVPGIGEGMGQLYTFRSPPLFESNYPVINRIKIEALTANIPLPVGTVVNIYGVRA